MAAYDYRCESCDKYIPVDRSNIKVGDDVSFTTTYQTSRTARFSSKQGTVKAITGDVCEINVGKKTYLRNIADVSPTDAPNALTYALFGTCKCNKEATPNGD
ncbi:hypothetical protein [Acinetobacter haemolyticus]|uniref:hypothetical protein n=1 Tax=Acinetobacter haemolyticus TaxID=29430 RepID=UPI00325B13B2